MKKLLLSSLLLAPTYLIAGEATLPHIFNQGQSARADEVNANFNALAIEITDNFNLITQNQDRLTTLEQAPTSLPRVIKGDTNQFRRTAGASFTPMDQISVPNGNWHVNFDYMLTLGGSTDLIGECRLTSLSGTRESYQHLNCCDLGTRDNASLSTVVTGPITVSLECKRTSGGIYFDVLQSSVTAIEVGTILQSPPIANSYTRNTPQ